MAGRGDWGFEIMDTEPFRILILCVREAAHYFVEAGDPGTSIGLNSAATAAESALAQDAANRVAIGHSVPSGPPALTGGDLESLRLADDFSKAVIYAREKYARSVPRYIYDKALEYQKSRGLETWDCECEECYEADQAPYDDWADEEKDRI